MKTKITFLLLLVCVISKVTSQDITQVWTHEETNTGGKALIFNSAVDTNDNTYYIILREDSGGSLLPSLLVARDANGNEIYSVPVATEAAGNQVFREGDIAVDNANDFIYIAGSNSSSDRVAISKYQKSTGAFISSSISNVFLTEFTLPTALAVDTNGDIIVATAYGNFPFVYRVTRFLASGGIGWDSTFSVNDGIPRSITINPANGDIFVTGSAEFTIATTLLSISTTGMLNWKEDSSEANAQSVIISNDGNIIITGSSNLESTQYVKKYDMSGNLLWTGQGALSDTAFSIVEHPDGGFLVSGGVAVTIPVITFDTNLTISAYNTDGDFLWTYTESDNDSSDINDSHILSNGDIVAVGNLILGSSETAHISAYSANLLSIEDVNFENSFSIYPNPAKDIVTIKMNTITQRFLNYTITDMLGKKIKEGTIDDRLNHAIDIAELAKGTYILSVNNASSTFSRKLLID